MNECRTVGLLGGPHFPFVMCAVMSIPLNAVADGFDPWTQTARYALEQHVDLGAWKSADVGSVRVWLPMPADNEHQRLRSTTIESPWTYRVTQDAIGNQFVYLEPGGAASTGGEVVMRFVVERAPHDGISRLHAKLDTRLDPRRYLRSLSRIPLTGQVHEYAIQAGAGLVTDGQRIRADYDLVTRIMKYAKFGDGWGRGDAVWACKAKYGNCTDFHSVIIGMCRSQGIPARFVIGFPIPADKAETQIHGYHCWVEAYDHDFGWLPMDASEAWKTKRFDAYYGRLPSDRVAFTVGRDLILEPPQNGEPLNYFIDPYAEVQGKPAGTIPWNMHALRLGANSH